MDAASTPRKKILVIDDEPSIVKYLEAVLEDHGYDTVSASDGNEGLEKVRTERPDLVCLDITMPRKSGIRFYQEIKEDPELAHIPVVVVTAVTGAGGDPEPFREFLGTRPEFAPPEEFIAKPIEPESFLQSIAQVLDG